MMAKNSKIFRRIIWVWKNGGRKEQAEQSAEENKELLECLREALDGKVKQVVLSQRLSHPVCLSSDGEISLEMEKVLNAMPNSEMVKAQRVLEINANHPVFKALQKLYPDQKEKLGTYASLLYTQALLIEGVAIEDPVGFSNQICELMTKEKIGKDKLSPQFWDETFLRFVWLNEAA